jgi:hypothetical protein
MWYDPRLPPSDHRGKEFEKTSGRLLPKYYALKQASKQGLDTDVVANHLVDIVGASATLLGRECSQVALTSMVAGKKYFSYGRGARLSRPINEALFIADPAERSELLEALRVNGGLQRLGVGQSNRALYTAAMAFCAAIDLLGIGNKKTPGTYFEILIGHLFAVAFGRNPRKRVEVLALEDQRSTLPTDYVFDLGPKQVKFHLPVKISTRERVIQVWAHQRILDGVYGEGRFRGILVALGETKLGLKKREVVEICLPDQWAVYQRFIARLYRVYYLDLPAKYAALATAFPNIAVKTIGEFFAEKTALLTA